MSRKRQLAQCPRSGRELLALAIKHRIVRPAPDAAEWFDLHVAERVLLPGLVGMHRTLRVNVRRSAMPANGNDAFRAQ
jgi:hypothetical protein